MEYYRSNIWNKDDDLILSETVLHHIRDGRTLVEGYTEAGRLLGRTKNACGQRWKSILSKKYPHAIELAKQKWAEKKRALRR